ncbi:DNA-methyltransferase [Limosilactobacillus reuteri]|uniref:DNA-methyltransferase n=1 Tax=Limosilactobacillus reuteri TaxID=1598 RepID=UPI001E34AAB1|nr:DNA methyltransferase [Limosilactobacillus reuteri]MCC4368205.1 site-specific DNA-methyltransferase [Limosilactobacillus reuteri]
MRSKRNKTIDFTLEEASPELLNQIIQPTDNLQTISDKIINGDSFKVMTNLSPHQVDLALIDPPYNLNKQYDGLSFKKMSTNQYQTYTQKWIDLLKPLLKENASIYVFSDWATSMALAPILEKNFTIQNRITWQREKGRGSMKNWKNGMEDIWFLTANPTDYTFNVDQVKQRRQVVAPYRQDGVAKDWQATKNGNFRDTMPSNFWDDISIPYWSMPENTGHPTQKPEKLLAKIILASSNPNDFIFDPFAGSGSSLVTAAKLNRRYLGIEQSLLYCAWGQYRLNQVKDDSSIQGYTDGVFWERNTLAVQRKIKRQQKANEK